MTDSSTEIWTAGPNMAEFIVFRCPDTGVEVQTSIPTESSGARTYQGLLCVACTRLHFIDTATGKLVSAAQRP